MSVFREKENFAHVEKKPRDSSSSRKVKRTDSADRRPIITQEKMSTTKQSSTSLKDKRKSQSDKIATEKSQKRKTKIPEDTKTAVVKDKKSTKQIGTGKIKVSERESRLDATYLKSLLEKKEVQKSSSERNAKEKLIRNRTRTRTLSPTEVKQLIPSKMAYELASGDLNVKVKDEQEERRNDEEEEAGGGDAEYEDDFEDYDSDFEEDDDTELQESSVFRTSLESSLESQTHESLEVEDQWKSTVRKKELDAVKQSIEKENNDLLEKRKSISQTSGDDSDKENLSVKKSSSAVVTVSSVSRNQKKTSKVAASRKRGEELLNMISLDTISYSILEIPPIPYDEFMKLYGKSDTKQIYVQTNEDDLDEEVQTDEIQLSNKWVQNPPEFLGRKKSDNESHFILTKEERLGVGGDVPLEEEITINQKTNALWNFLSSASQKVFIELEKNSGNFLSLENIPNHSKATPFGDGFVSLNVDDIPFLKGRSVTHLCLFYKAIRRLLSVHTNKEKSFQKCMICFWSLREPSKPLKILMAFNQVTSICFGPNQGNLVFAGLSDGTISLWDLREPSVFHNRMTGSFEWNLQSPTYTTAGFEDANDNLGPIVALRLLSKNFEESSKFKDFTPMQICSLDKEGTIVIWTVVQLKGDKKAVPSADLGLAPWGRVKLIKSSSFSISTNLREELTGLYFAYNDIFINEEEDNGLYVANSLGKVHHCSSSGFPMKPKFYVPSKQDAFTEATCLELCPFNGSYFLVGCSDGTIRLHSIYKEKPLICLSSDISENQEEAAVVCISWMPKRPCVFIALDSISRINIWNLKVSDMYPEVSFVLAERKIISMVLLPVSDPREVPSIVIGTEGGSIEIYKLKNEYGGRTNSDVENEKKMFLKYVSIL